MNRSRRWFLQSLAAGTASLIVRPLWADRGERVDKALAAAADFLLKHQSKDGAWRSDHYGPFKDGAALTPLVVRTLHHLGDGQQIQDASSRGAQYLAKMVKSNGEIESGTALNYPLYTAAGAVIVLSHARHANLRPARDAWLAYLRERQLIEVLGWQPDDKPYGGWGYCPLLPRKPTKADESRAPLTESNLSATVYALDALHAAGVKSTDPAMQKAAVFVQRCQNHPDDPKRYEARFDDGGFYFIYDDPVRNKAGVAGKDRAGRERYRSYGSMTADGWRALLILGRPADAPRKKAAYSWMETHFRADIHPGNYAPDREASRGAVYYYYCASMAQTMGLSSVKELRSPNGKVNPIEAMVGELLKHQRQDGSWVNALVPQREDDPLVATSLAAMALSYKPRA